MEYTVTTSTNVRKAGFFLRILPWILLLLGIGLLVGCGFAIWSEIKFRRIAIETDGRVVDMIRSTSRDRDGRTSVNYKPVFVYHLPDGKEIRVEGGVASNPPCCRVGDPVRVRYDPAHPARAAMTGFTDSWLVASILGGMGLIFTLIGITIVRAFGPRSKAMAMVQAASAAPTHMVPLAGLRREMGAEGMRWIVQARWQHPQTGATRLFESPPLPFDPVPQMRQMSSVQIRFDPSVPDGPYQMDLSFLDDSDSDATMAMSPVRRG